ncbi:MAG: class I SAM-dependent methyltransferase [Candidatus Methanofastidiosa archaeon]|nr:class I SAM-dependent methyltransferase [Candidatus Methanofastidiosa archaeon]
MTYEDPNIMDVILEKLLLDMFISPRLMRKYIKMLDLRGDENVMEFGCGAGNSSRWLAKELSRGALTCVDISEFWLDKAKKRMRKYANVRYMLGDVTKNEMNEKFDLIFIHQVIHDLPKSKRQETIMALKGMLAKGGRIFIGEPINMGHGMPVSEIEGMMESSGMKEDNHYFDKALLIGQSYIGVYSISEQGN